MVIFPNCKINIGLRITAKRPDGYHNLETVFFPVPFYDVLEIVPAGTFAFSCTGAAVAGAAEDNICVKAYRLLQARFPALPPVLMHLHKALPMGAGLGGGSSDGAHALLLLNGTFGLGLSPEQLADYALQLGSDCPFFIHNRPCYATGRGELLEPLSLHLEGLYLVLVMPGIHVSTGAAFAGIQPAPGNALLPALLQLPVQEWRHTVANDFEKTVFALHPRLGEIKRQLYEAGAVYAAMSGSGSTIYGLFEKNAVPAALPEMFAGTEVRVIENLGA